MRTRPLAHLSAAIALALGGLACTSTSTTTTASTAGTTATTAAGTTATTASAAQTALFDRAVQGQLKAVGCYTGNVDGIIGPETDAAIIAFQKAAGLTVDGHLGPQTDAALDKDAAAGKKVCTGAGTTTTTAAGTTSTTSTTAKAGVAPCTATAISEGLGVATHAVNLESYVCSGNYAAGTQQATPPQFILQSTNGKWAPMAQSPCGTASAGIPPVILETGCPPAK